MAAKHPLPGFLTLVICCSFASSSILPSPQRQVEGFQASFAADTAQTFDPRTGRTQGFTVTARQCNVIKRVSSYERTKIPFLCEPSGQTLPMPRKMDQKKAKVLAAMKAEGWTMCYKSVAVPVYKFQRIPVCCPGTFPTNNGGCISRNGPVPNGPYMSGANPMPVPSLINGYRPTANIPIIVQKPRPLRNMMLGPGMSPAELIQHFMLSSRSGPSYATDNMMQGPPMMSMVPIPPYARPGPQGSGDMQDEMAMYLISVMYQQLMTERRQQLLQEEIERQIRIMLITQQRRLAQQRLIHEMILKHAANMNNDASSVPRLIPAPNLNPSDPTNELETTTYGPESETTSMNSGMLDQQSTPLPTKDLLNTDDSGAQWTGEGPGILDSNPDLRIPQLTTPAPEVYIDGTHNTGQFPPQGMLQPGQTPEGPMPQLPPGVTQQQVTEMQNQIKGVVEDCLRKSSIVNSMEAIVKSGDVNLLRPVCLASESIGPCIMGQAQQVIRRDSVGMIGRQMVQGIMMSVGGLCMELQKSGQLETPPTGSEAPPTGSPALPTGMEQSITPNAAPSRTNEAGIQNSYPEMKTPEITTPAPEGLIDGTQRQNVSQGMPQTQQPQMPRGPQTSQDQTSPGQMPQLPPGVTQQQVMEIQDKIKAIVEDCLKKSSITSSMETIVQSGDVNLLRPICLGSETIGPCIMHQAKQLLEPMGQDNLGMVGRQMVQGIMMSMGGLCMQLKKSGQLDAAPTGTGNGTPHMPTGMTSPPVFPNPAPSMSSPAVTDSVESKFSHTVNSNVGATPSASKTQSNNAVSQTPVAQPSKEEVATPHSLKTHQGNLFAESASSAQFPMWLILALVGGVAFLLILTCITVCLCLRCRRKKKEVEMNREPEKLPVPVEGNVYAASPCVPPPAYLTTAVPQTLGAEENLDKNFKIPEDEPEEGKETTENK